MHATKTTCLVPMALGLLLALSGCSEDTLAADCANIGTGAAAARVESFVESANAFSTSAQQLLDRIDANCRKMAMDLGVTVPASGTPTSAATSACRPVSEEIRRIVNDALPPQAQLTLSFVPPRCSVQNSSYVDCVASCDVNVMANASVMCEAGRLVGMCSGTCSGSCRVSGSANCTATCEGQCTGTCTADCFGTCDGTCQTMGANGECAGQCTGTCTGRCEGNCTGSCTGQCTAMVNGACMGECAGSCSVDFQAPRCEGDVMVAANAECESSCEAKVQVEATCTEPTVAVTTTAMVDSAANARFMTLLATLEANWGEFLALSSQVELVASSGQQFVDDLQGLGTSVADAGLNAVACTAQAASAAAEGVASVSLSVEVTVEVQASVEAQAQ